MAIHPAEQRLTTLAQDLGIDPADLDDVVHDLHSKPASQINNSGLHAQISYLIDQLGETDIETLIRDAANKKKMYRYRPLGPW